MKKRILLVVFLTVTLALSLFLPVVSLADNEDFDVSYVFRTTEVGYNGGIVSLEVTVTNTGPTEINYVDTIINTSSGFNDHHITNIPPGEDDVWYYDVYFAPEDLNKELTMLFSMNNDAFPANPDGIQIEKFEMSRIDELFDITASISPSKTEYYFGETVRITHEYESLVSMSLERIASRIIVFGNMTGPGEHMLESEPEEVWTLGPGASFDHEVSLRLTDDADGGIAAYYMLNFEYLGVSYYETDALIRKNVVERIPEIEFDAVLSAEPLSVMAGETVDMAITIHNTGDDAIESFEIVDMEGITIAELDELGSGETQTFAFTETFAETASVFYSVTGRTSGRTEEYSAEVMTNTLTITILVPPEPTEAETEEPEATDEPVQTKELQQTDEPVQTEEPQQIKSTSAYLYWIVGALALLLLAAGVFIWWFVRKKNKNSGDESKE